MVVLILFNFWGLLLGYIKLFIIVVFPTPLSPITKIRNVTDIYIIIIIYKAILDLEMHI